MPSSSNTSFTKLHNKIVRSIYEYMQNQHLKKGDRLPSQEKLAILLDTSRSTLREALAHLASEGVIRQVHGIGTFIAEDISIIRSYAEIDFSITEMIRDQGMEPGTRDVMISFETIPFQVSPKIPKEVETKVMRLTRVRTADGEPFVYAIAYLPLSLKGLVLEEEAYMGSLYVFLQEHCNEFVCETQSIIEAQYADAVISQKLGIPEQTLILVLKQRHYNQEGNLLFKSEAHFVQNKFQLVVRRIRKGLDEIED